MTSTALAIALAAIVAVAFFALDAPASAQSDDETVGRIVARRLDDGRVEYGWQPNGGTRVLPSLRHFPAPTNATVDRWLDSSPVEVDGAAIGRINARLQSDGRIEFAFTPTDGERILTDGRYFPTTAGVGRWLRSTKITLTVGPPVIDSISCDPSLPTVDESVTCTATISGGAPTSWDWSGGESSSDQEDYNTRFQRGGEHTVSLTVRNAAGSDEDSITITVNTPPESIGSIADIALGVNGDEEIDVSGAFRDPDGDSLTYGMDSDNDVVIWSIFGSAITLVGVSDGSAMVTVTATDPRGASADQTFTITVDDNTPPETIGSIADVSLDVGGSETIDLSGQFRDPDGDPLIYTADSDNSAVGARVSGTSVIVEGRRAGSATVSVTAADGNSGSATQWFDVSVGGAPVIDSIICTPSPSRVKEPVLCEASLSGGTPDSYSWSDSDGGSGGGGPYYRKRYRSVGTLTITLAIRNSVGSDSSSVSVTVINTPPTTVGSIADISVEVNGHETVNVYDKFSDYDAHPLTYSAVSDGSAVRVSASGSLVTVEGRSAGSATVTVTADDGNGGSATQSFGVTVASDEPAINSLSCTPSSPTVNQSVSCTASLSGGPPDSYSWSDSDGGSGDSASYSTNFSTSGTKTVSLTVTNSAGNDSDSIDVVVQQSRFTAVSSGFGYVCGLTTSAMIECWGNNSEGQASAPTGSFVAVDTSAHIHPHTCGLSSSGTIECWATDKPGWESFGLGDIPTGSFTAVSVGQAYTCGLRDTGAIMCWGSDYGTGRTGAPQGSFTAVSVGDSYGCGLRDSGQVVCWGARGHGQADAPEGNFTFISAGRAHACGMRDTGTIECWGYNYYGQSNPPAGSYVSVSAGHSHTCAIRSTGDVVCWGSNTDANDRVNGKATPPSGRFTSVSTAEWYTCGVRDTGEIECWGSSPAR